MLLERKAGGGGGYGSEVDGFSLSPEENPWGTETGQCCAHSLVFGKKHLAVVICWGGQSYLQEQAVSVLDTRQEGRLNRGQGRRAGGEMRAT